LIVLLVLMAIPLGMGLAMGPCPAGSALCPTGVGFCVILLAVLAPGLVILFGVPGRWVPQLTSRILSDRLDRPPRR
jgi:hypothetical protein